MKGLNYKHVRVSVIDYINILFKDTASSHICLIDVGIGYLSNLSKQKMNFGTPKDKSIITPSKLNLIYNYNLSDIPFQLMMLPR